MSGSLILPAQFVFLKIAFDIWDLLCFHTNCKNFCSNSVKNTTGNLIGIALTLSTAFSSIDIFTIFFFQSKNMVSLYLLVSSLISFKSILLFSKYRSFTSFGRFILRYFILFDVMVNGIVSLISLSDLLLLVHRNSRDFCILVLYPATLPNSLMSSSFLAVIFQNSPGKNTGVGSHFLFQAIFSTQALNPGLLCFRQILNYLSHQGSPSLL